VGGGDFMKKALVIIVALVFVLSIAGLSFAKEKSHATTMHVSGEVTAVDAAANTLTIKGKKGEVMLNSTDKTKFAEGKTLADVKVGDKLTAKYSEKDGKMMAWKVMTKKEMKAAKKEKKHINEGKKEMKKEKAQEKEMEKELK
jgi:type 1 fimbria pilin